MISPANHAQEQPCVAATTRSVEEDVKRLADIRASLQDIQRRKSAPAAGVLTPTASTSRFRLPQGSCTPNQRFGENAYPMLHSTGPYFSGDRQQPLAQRDLNREIKVYTKPSCCALCLHILFQNLISSVCLMCMFASSSVWLVTLLLP